MRLKGHDYSQAGAYFVTLCTQSRECLFGEIVDMEMRLNELGRIVSECWDDMPKHFPNVELDEFVMMPNHMHGIILITVDVGAKHLQIAANASPLHGTQSGSLGAIIQNFKSVSTRKINQLREPRGVTIWQRNYFEHIIRNDKELNSIRDYIAANPARWEEDKENPALEISETRVHHVGL